MKSRPVVQISVCLLGLIFLTSVRYFHEPKKTDQSGLKKVVNAPPSADSLKKKKVEIETRAWAEYDKKLKTVAFHFEHKGIQENDIGEMRIEFRNNAGLYLTTSRNIKDCSGCEVVFIFDGVEFGSKCDISLFLDKNLHASYSKEAV